MTNRSMPALRKKAVEAASTRIAALMRQAMFSASTVSTRLWPALAPPLSLAWSQAIRAALHSSQRRLLQRQSH